MYYTTKQAAEYLGYQPSSIRRFVRSGQLVPTNRAGHPRFTKTELDRFAHRGRVVAPASLYAAILPRMNPLLQKAMER